MSINIQLDGKLQKISGQTMTKEKIVEKLGYTPANEATVDANIAELNSNLDVLEGALEDHKNSMSDIDAGGADDEFIIADSSGNVIAKIDDEGLHTTNIEAESFASNDKELTIIDADGNKAFSVDENGITHAAKLELNSGDVDLQLGKLSADLSAHDSNTVKHVTTEDKARWDNKSDIKSYTDLPDAPDITPEDNENSLVITDRVGNIALRAGELDGDGSIGVETVTIKAASASIGNIYTKAEVDAQVLEHKTATNAHTKDQVGLSNVDNTSDADKPVSAATQVAIDSLKSELSEQIESESNEWQIVDGTGNVVLKVGELGEDTAGLETVAIKAKTAVIDNVYNKTEVDAIIAEITAIPDSYIIALCDEIFPEEA